MQQQPKIFIGWSVSPANAAWFSSMQLPLKGGSSRCHPLFAYVIT
jgi:hypothetical protein